MPSPPKGLARRIQQDVRRFQNYADAPAGYWRTRRDALLFEVEAAFSRDNGEANKLAMAVSALFAIIEEKAASKQDISTLVVLYHNIANRADGRPAVQPITHQMLKALDQEITSLKAQGLPTSALDHAIRRMGDKHRERFEGINGRAGGAKPINTVNAQVMYCVLWEQTFCTIERKALTSAAVRLTGLLPAQLRQQRNNLKRRRKTDETLDRLFVCAIAAWETKRSRNLSDYII